MIIAGDAVVLPPKPADAHDARLFWHPKVQPNSVECSWPKWPSIIRRVWGGPPLQKKNPADAPDAGLGWWVVCDPCVVGGWWGGPCSNSNRVQRRSAAVGLVLIPQNYLENQEARDVVPGWEFGPKTNPPISSSRLGGSFWRFSSLASGLGGGGWWVVGGGWWSDGGAAVVVVGGAWWVMGGGWW